jgi:uncharacterized protein YlaN (UPF0358 family)
MEPSGVTAQVIESISAPKEQVQEAPQDQDFANKLAIIAKKEKAIMAEKSSFAQKLKELEEKEGKLKQWEELDQLVTDNPSEFFKKKGLSFEQIQQKMLESMQDDELDPIQKKNKEMFSELKSELAKLKEENEKLIKGEFEQRDTKEKQKYIDEQSKHYKAELNNFIQENSEKYDLINTYGVADEVFKVMQAVYIESSKKGSPRVMGFDEVCDLYEKGLEDKVMGMSKSNKVKKLLGLIDSEDPIAQMFGQKTIDDSFTASAATGNGPQTEKERMQAAAKIFEQSMKQN